MKNRYALLTACCLLLSPIVQAQFVAIPPSGIVQESFNSMGSGTGSILPTAWHTNTTHGSGGTAITYGIGSGNSITQAANSGSPSAGGKYNWGTTAGTDRAVGFMTSSSPNIPSPNAVLVQYLNTTNATVTSVTLSFSVERYVINTNSFSLNLYSSLNGNSGSWTARTDGDISTAVFLPGANAFTFGTPQKVYKTVTISGLNIAHNGSLFFMWVFNTGAGNTSQGLGLDDVTLQVGTGAPNVSGSLKDVLSNDANSNGIANPGDKITYNATVRNRGNANAGATTYTNPAQPNTTASGSPRTSALANDDAGYTTGVNIGISNQATVLGNDFGLPSLSVAAFGNTNNTGATVANGSNTALTDNGGTVLMNANGTFGYTPAANFVGYDKFGYTARTSLTTPPDNDAIVTIAVGTAPSAVNDMYNVIGNVHILPDAAQGLLANDQGSNKAVIAVNGSTSNLGANVTLSNGGVVNVASDGSFTYQPLAGYTGSESFTYTIDNAFAAPSIATCSLSIGGTVWFVNNNLGSNGNGTLASPFNNLASLAGINNGIGNNPAAGDNIFLYGGGADYTGGIILLSAQRLIGSGAASSVATLTTLTPAAYSAQFPATGGTAPTIVNGSGDGVMLNNVGGSNSLYGFNIGNCSSVALNGQSFGTLTEANVSINTTGTAIVLGTGTLITNFPSVSSAGGFTNINLNTCSGSMTIGGGNLTGAANTPVTITGGSVNMTTANNITKSTLGNALVQATNGHSGVLTFQTGTLQCNVNAAGIWLNNADGTYNFNGPVSMNGCLNGLAVENGSSGTIFVSSTSSITNPTSEVLLVTGSAPTLTFAANFSKTNNSFIGIDINNNTGGLININGTSKVLSTGSAIAVKMATNTNLSTSFQNGGLAITTTTAKGMELIGSNTVNITGSNNTINTGSGLGLDIQNTNAGASGITFASIMSTSGEIANIATSTGTKTLGRIVTSSSGTVGLNLTSAGTVNVGDASFASTLQTTTAPGVNINATDLQLTGQGLDVTTTGTGAGVNAAGGTVSITGGNLNIITGAGTGFNANSGGTVSLTGSNNTISSGTGTALNVANTTIGAGNLNFQSITAGTPASGAPAMGININTTGASGGLVVTGTGTTAGSGGTIQKCTHGVYANGVNSISLSNMNIINNGQNQTLAGSSTFVGGNLRTGNNLSAVANITLFTVNTVSLTALSVTGSAQMGINGNGVSSFTMLNSAVTGNGNEGFENGITFQNLFGTCSITATIIKNNAARQIHVSNVSNNTSLVLGITGTRTNNAYPTMDASTTVIGNDAPSGANTQQGILFETNTASTGINMTLNLTGIVFPNNYPQNAVDIQPIAASGVLGGTATNCSFDINAGGVIISMQNGSGAQTSTYNVTNCEFNRSALQSILYAAANPWAGHLSGTVSGNTIGTTGQSGSAVYPTTGANATGIDVNLIGGTGSIDVRIQNNTVQQFDGVGINVKANGNGALNANIVSNQIQSPLGLVAHGISTNIGTTAGATVAGCLGITSNTITGTYEDPCGGCVLKIVTNVRFNATHKLPGYGGSATSTSAAFTFISGNNGGATGLSQIGGSGTYPGGAGCVTP